jgi:hypothetical protein
LKHTRRHEKGREESNQETKHSGSGGPSGQEGRTVRKGLADRPACCHGLSAHTPQTVRPCATDHPKKQTEPPETTPNNGPSAGSMRTVRQAPTDRPPAVADCPKPCPTKTQSHDGSKAKSSKNTKNKGRTRSSRTVRASRIELKTARPRRSTPPNHHRIYQMVEAMETMVWGLERVTQGCYSPKILRPNSLNHRES